MNNRHPLRCSPSSSSSSTMMRPDGLQGDGDGNKTGTTDDGACVAVESVTEISADYHSNTSPRSSSFNNVRTEDVDADDERISFGGRHHHQQQHFQKQQVVDDSTKKHPPEESSRTSTHRTNNKHRYHQSGSSFPSSYPTSIYSSFQETALDRERSLPQPPAAAPASSPASFSNRKGNTTTSSSTSSSTSTVRKQRLLPAEFQPSPYSVIVGRSKEHKGCTGNLRLRELARSYVSKYATAKLKIEKSLVVTDLITTIENACRRPKMKTKTTKENTKATNLSDVDGDDGEDVCADDVAAIGAFIRFDRGRWWEVDENTAREKVGYVLRELMTEHGLHTYKSSSKAKTASRRRKRSITGDIATTSTTTNISSMMAPEEGSMDVFDRPIFPVNTTTISRKNSRSILYSEERTNSKTLDNPDGDGKNSNNDRTNHYEK